MSQVRKAAGARHALKVLSQWPKDNIRPDTQFSELLGKRFEKLSTRRLSPAEEQHELGQANALYSLLDNRYQKKYPITGTLLEPKSNPNYFTDLVRELDEAPNRTYLDRLMLRLKGLVRLR